MTSALLLPWVILAWLFGRSSKADLSTHATPMPGAPAPRPRPSGATAATVPSVPPAVVPVSHSTAVKVQPAPWPQVVPAGLPGFPGPSWIPDNPPGAGVVARATALIPTLWAHGPGTFKTEQTAGRWITYRATPMGAKKGVVAFKLATEPSVRPPEIKVGPTEIVTPAPAPSPRPTPAPAATVPVSTSPVALSTLRLKSPRMSGPDVVTLQKRLGLSADGVFGSGTHAAVLAFQRSKGLTPDGIVGRQTWAALFGGGAA